MELRWSYCLWGKLRVEIKFVFDGILMIKKVEILSGTQ